MLDEQKCPGVTQDYIDYLQALLAQSSMVLQQVATSAASRDGSGRVSAHTIRMARKLLGISRPDKGGVHAS